MHLTDFFRVIGARDVHPGATEAAIMEADIRLGGRLPDALRNWFREADGFPGEAGECMWRFKSLERLRTIPQIFEDVQGITIVSPYGPAPARSMPGSQYVIFCDALIYLPFYAVNICADSPHYAEVICASEEAPSEATFVSSSFEVFAEFLFEHPEHAFLFIEAEQFPPPDRA